jgi:hypothetical protein
MRVTTLFVFGAWFFVMAYLGSTGFFLTPRYVLGLSIVQQAIVFPMALFWAAFLFMRPIRCFVRSADLTFLVALQGIRILALSHLVSWGYGLMAGGFAIPVAIGNLAVCVLALSSVSAVAHQRGRWQARVYVLTGVGLLEFLMTIALAVFGFFSASLAIDPLPAPGGYISFATTPLSLFPTYAIPALTLVHFTTILALRYQGRAASNAPGPRPASFANDSQLLPHSL